MRALLILALVGTVGLTTNALLRGAEEQQPISVSQLLGRRPIGLLGKPLGERVTIQGRMVEHSMLANAVAIEKVGDDSVKQAVKIEVTGVEIKKGIHYQLEGYESGAFVGNPEWLNPNVQQPFQYRPSFVVTRVVEPAAITDPRSGPGADSGH